MYANNANLLEEGKYDGGDWLWNAAYAGDPGRRRSQGWLEVGGADGELRGHRRGAAST